MTEYESMVARQRKWMFFLLAILVLGAGFTPYLQIFLGLLLGSAVSFYNLWLLQKKVRDFSGTVLDNQPVKGLGTVSRFAAAILVVLIALRFEEYFNVFAVIFGLVSSYIIIMADFIFRTMLKK